jgi:hypothetical protein
MIINDIWIYDDIQLVLLQDIIYLHLELFSKWQDARKLVVQELKLEIEHYGL